MKRRLVHVTTVPESLSFLSGQVRYMKSRGWDVHAISSPGPKLTAFGSQEGIEVHSIEMPRRITPLHDLRAVGQLASQLKSLSPSLVHSHTPKGGLLGMLAAASTRVPIRIYHMRGLPYSTATSARRKLLMTTERLSCALAHQVLCQSHSLRRQALDDRICTASKLKVLAQGSNGVDALGRFNPALLRQFRRELRRRMGWGNDHIVFGFVGRLVRDKGLTELVEAWRVMRDQLPNARLLLVGHFEPQDPVADWVRTELESDPTIFLPGFSDETEKWYAAMDVFVLPTYREGFPNAPLEASAMELPVVATKIPGCVDAVVEDETGTLVQVRSSKTLADALLRYGNDPSLRRRHGEAGRKRVLRDFTREQIWSALADVYEQQLSKAQRLGRLR